MPANPKPPKPIRDAKHLENIRQCCCVICAHPATAAHHLLRTPEKAMGRRSGDRWTVPLCEAHHRQLHMSGNERGWFAKHGFSHPSGRAAMSLAENFWAMRDKPDFMQQFARMMAKFGRERVAEVARRAGR